ncbi:MAG: hypothetical protein H6Q74_1656 [Firmicutes bacterium]|nr:hypothetical protein [Bacillota bacterium]
MGEGCNEKERKNRHCVINIFCGCCDKQDDKCDDKWDIESDGKCVINIFCGSKQEKDQDDNW